MNATLIATYTKDKDAQSAINLLIEHGFDSDNISVVMLDKEKESKFDTDDNFDASLSDMEDEEDIDKAEDLDYEIDEEDFSDSEGGVIEPIGGINLGDNNIDSFGDGDFMVGGPILEEIDDLETLEDAPEEVLIAEVLMALGISDEEVEGYEGRIKNGEILVSITVDVDDVDEYREVLGTGEPTTLEVIEEE
jgi:hypothetical protein